MKSVRKAISDGFFLFDVRATDVADVFRQASTFLTGRGVLPNEVRDEVVGQYVEREQADPSAIGNGIAIPHLYRDGIAEPVILFVRLAKPMNLGAPDGIPVQFFFLLLGPPEQRAEHLDLLMHIAQLTADNHFRYEARVASDQESLLRAIDNFIGRAAPPVEPAEPTEEIPDELQYKGGFGRGLFADVRRRYRHYLSDITDGLNPKTVSSTLFLFFACLAPAVTFGGIMSPQTNGDIGTVEMLVASVICGVVYALVSAQPLIILGGTGPLLIVTVIIVDLCELTKVPFLPVYGWVGLWTMAFTILLAVTDSSCLMRYFTRFTDEIFAALISLIFISESLKAIIDVFRDVYRTGTVSHDKALLTLLLAVGTYYLALNLSGFRRSRYLRQSMREFLADFGPSLALATMSLVALALRDVKLDSLRVPTTFGTTSGRPWQVNIFAAPVWTWIAAAIPALFVTILVYLDQNITARLVNNPKYKMEKGAGYHLDLAVVGGLIGVCSLFGLPWLVAATVRSLNHVRSLATAEEVVTSNGDTKERIIHTRETRLTGLAIHVLIGLSLFFLSYLRVVPMAVLYGLFLYMGVVSMRGNQFFERLSLWPMDQSLYPVTHYIRRVPLKVIHLFTLIQLVCLVILWALKVSVVAILFPLFIAVLAPIRTYLDRFFDPKHLAILDQEEDDDPDDEDWG